MTVIKEFSGGSWNTIVVGAAGATGGAGPQGTAGDWSSGQTIKDVSTSTYQIDPTDKGKLLRFTGTAACAVTVPSGLNFSPGQRVDLLSWGQTTGNQVTVAGSGTTIRATPTLKLRTTYSAATLICISGDTFVLVGDLAAS